ncbi:recombination protein RecR [candidate division CPR3 bacterium 4484_211]|uniref:Recombination protein RecR n=1 Tax=candidate division CPR3 bacterium 4484_211 TaxID=1968527 RepID=A0A1W9NY29_UNCC3|nr:MAG: recombination protein RecR [candidate division CPR3 bacterium 4484_211]
MKVIKPVQNLIDEFRKLPTIGPKTAARLVYHLIKAPKLESERLAEAILLLKDQTTVCESCFNIAEQSPCQICRDENRDRGLICVVEEPLDVAAIEKTGRFCGLYHVLGGVINPMMGIGPDELRIRELIDRLNNKSVRIREVILATNPSMEGEATAMYIKERIQKSGVGAREEGGLKITRIARGLPTGGDLEYADNVTLSRALEGRTEF